MTALSAPQRSITSLRYPPKERRSGQAELRFAHHDRTRRQRRQVCQHLAPALCQCCAAPNAEGHVAAHLKADPLQLLPGHLRRIQRPQRLEHRSAVGAAAGHSRLHGDALFQQDLRAAVLHAHGVIKGPGRLPGDVARPAREILPIRSDGDVTVSRLRTHGHGIVERDALHHHPQIVIPVRTLS